MEATDPLICVPVCEPGVSSLEASILQAASVADIIEIRVDCLDPLQIEQSIGELDRLSKLSAKPTIITYRPAEQGGKQELTTASRFSFWVFNRPEGGGFFDIEHDFACNPQLFEYVNAPDWSRVICSFHDVVGMPSDLDSIYEKLASSPAHILKIAVQANDVIDCIDIFRSLERAGREGRKIIAIAMGFAGIATRILGPSRGAFFTYASMDEKSATATGQLTVRELRDIYRIDKIDRDTEIFGVVGLPVTHSISPNIHNAAFATTETNAVYIPFEVRDPGSFIRRMVHPRTREIEWKIRGLSVTAPHKTALMDQLDWVEPIAKEIGAVNTLLIDDELVSGYNTDADGFLEGLRTRVTEIEGKRCAVIGSGGAASAAVWALKKEAADVTVFARTRARADGLAAKFDSASGDLENAQFGAFDLVVNATSLGSAGEFQHQSPANAAQLRGAHWAYDLVYNPIETQFLREASEAGCETINGLEMFIAQAAAQFKLWTGTTAPKALMHEVAERALRERSE